MTEQEKQEKNNLRVVAIVLGSLILALVIFAAGVSVGIHKARFSGKFMENYERNFMGPKPEGFLGGPMGFMMHEFGGREFKNAHGIAGEIISIADNNILIKDPFDKENTVTVNDQTVIKRGRENIKITDLKNNDRIVVMGKPGDNGTVTADLIRVFDNNGNNNAPDVSSQPQN